jgi:hypothetical protein
MVSNRFLERHARLLRRIHMAAHTWDADTLATHVKWILDAEHAYWSTKPAGDSEEWRDYEDAGVADRQGQWMQNKTKADDHPFKDMPFKGMPVEELQQWIQKNGPIPDALDPRRAAYRGDTHPHPLAKFHTGNELSTGDTFPPFVQAHRDPVSGKLVPDMPNVQDMMMRSSFGDVVKAATPIIDYLRCNPIPLIPRAPYVEGLRRQVYEMGVCLCPLNATHNRKDHDQFQDMIAMDLDEQYAAREQSTSKEE